ncbi:hypothetical protein CCHR01_03442 [Colletotrichum chrysophilum]|uniref:Uncharacterized protein n=1 Tax=Colletotrichum chrysophilum TaxID=1836956 RepID=A0AAD9EJD7_9PEZI|nr:hypothetical protein CCHR01_03442 [Colletotrichum chrysophilum]
MGDIQTSIASFAHRNIPTRNQVINEWDISLPSRSGSRAIKPSQRGEQSQTSNPAAQRSPVAAANGIFSRCDESLGSLSFAETRPPTSTQGTISPAKSLSNHTVKSTIHAPIIASQCNAVRDFSSPTAKTISALEINLQKRSKQLAQHGRWLHNRCRRLANIQQPPCPLLEPVVSRPSRSWPGVMRSPQAPSRPPPACPCPSILAGFSLCLLTRACLAAQPFFSQESGTCSLAYLPSARWHRTSCACTLPYLTLPLRNLPSPNGAPPQGRGTSPFDCKNVSHCRCNPVRPSGVGSGSNMRRTWR